MGKLRKFTRGVIRPVVKEVDRAAVRVERSVKKEILPVVLGGRKRVTTSHVQADFQQEHITLVVTAGGEEVDIQEVSAPCPDGAHDIQPCTQPLEIELNGGGFVFNDTFCTKCGEHFPTIQ